MFNRANIEMHEWEAPYQHYPLRSAVVLSCACMLRYPVTVVRRSPAGQAVVWRIVQRFLLLEINVYEISAIQDETSDLTSARKGVDVVLIYCTAKSFIFAVFAYGVVRVRTCQVVVE